MPQTVIPAQSLKLDSVTLAVARTNFVTTVAPKNVSVSVLVIYIHNFNGEH